MSVCVVCLSLRRLLQDCCTTQTFTHASSPAQAHKQHIKVRFVGQADSAFFASSRNTRNVTTSKRPPANKSKHDNLSLQAPFDSFQPPFFFYMILFLCLTSSRPGRRNEISSSCQAKGKQAWPCGCGGSEACRPVLPRWIGRDDGATLSLCACANQRDGAPYVEAAFNGVWETGAVSAQLRTSGQVVRIFHRHD